MNRRSKQLDLVLRLRYSNPLPAPPCPPKLLNIPTDTQRYTNISFIDELAKETPFPMVIDAECGMPLDLAQWESLWTENGDDSDVNPNPEMVPPLDPRDAWMVEIGSSLTNGTNGSSSSLSNVHHVPWLRKTEYIGRETVRPAQSQEFKMLHHQAIDVSIDAQIRDVEKSFETVTDAFDLSKLTYPGKPGLKAVESWEIFPDEEIWANAYDLFKFSERPGDRPVEKDDPRLECALLRPMESDGEHFLAYYLVKEDQSIEELGSQRDQIRPDSMIEEASPHSLFHFVRDYETVKIEQDIANEFLFTFHNDDELKAEPGTLKRKAAYYKNIERKINLKKKRVSKYELTQYSDKWDAIQLSHSPFSQEELDERTEAAAEVQDPLLMFRAVEEEDGAADADGEVDVNVKAEDAVEPQGNDVKEEVAVVGNG